MSDGRHRISDDKAILIHLVGADIIRPNLIKPLVNFKNCGKIIVSNLFKEILKMAKEVMVEISARHVHVTKETLET
ncbi:MAG: hypothetical protein J5766_00435, partial [Clostridia bacterium]|nr:hypothetical protein [Clostridia bacterium]